MPAAGLHTDGRDHRPDRERSDLGVLGLVALVVFVGEALFVGFVVPGETAAILGGVAASLGQEGEIFRKVIGWSLGFLVLMSVIVLLQSNVLAWVLP